jgi:hypothetical protein
MLHKKVVEVRHEMSEDSSFKGFWAVRVMMAMRKVQAKA